MSQLRGATSQPKTQAGTPVGREATGQLTIKPSLILVCNFTNVTTYVGVLITQSVRTVALTLKRVRIL